jgi:cytochrome c-type biogenesis protein CcmH/NrfG
VSRIMCSFFAGFTTLLIPVSLHALIPNEKTHEQASAQVTVHARGAGCSVELDDQQLGKTDDHGVLVVSEVEPGDHYLHLSCPSEEEKAFFISPRSGENVALEGNKAEEASNPRTNPALSPAEAKIQLRQLVQQAVQLRARGRLDEAVEHLRAALKLDAENSDLHRELGITFLLGKDWKRARVEMLEAIRHDPTDADAYNGLGYALEKMGDLGGAVKQYRMATHLDPADPTYRTHYFDILSKLAQERAKKK